MFPPPPRHHGVVRPPGAPLSACCCCGCVSPQMRDWEDVKVRFDGSSTEHIKLDFGLIDVSPAPLTAPVCARRVRQWASAPSATKKKTRAHTSYSVCFGKPMPWTTSPPARKLAKVYENWRIAHPNRAVAMGGCQPYGVCVSCCPVGAAEAGHQSPWHAAWPPACVC